MYSPSRLPHFGLLGLPALLALLVACGDDTAPADAGLDAATQDAGGQDVGPADAGGQADAPSMDVPVTEDASADAGPGDDAGSDAGPPDPCDGAEFCELFDEYDPTDIGDGDRFGPWRAAFEGDENSMRIDTTRAASGDNSLRIHIEDGARRGGRLFTQDGQAVFDGGPTQMYGRMMMYVEENGHSVHWTWGGLSGTVIDEAPTSGRRGTYLMSSLRSDDANQFSSVYYVNADPAQDCWNRGSLPIPEGRWMCIEFAVDSEGRTVRVDVDGENIIDVNGTGQGCVGDVPNDTPWWGPSIEQFYVGAWSFHPMVGDIDVWIDDVALDSAPLACP